MTVEKLAQVVVRLEELDLVVVAAVSDMDPMNETMWRRAGVGDQRSWIVHPADQNRLVPDAVANSLLSLDLVFFLTPFTFDV